MAFHLRLGGEPAISIGGNDPELFAALNDMLQCQGHVKNDKGLRRTSTDSRAACSTRVLHIMKDNHRSNFLVIHNRSESLLIACMVRGRGLFQFFPSGSAGAMNENLVKRQELGVRELGIDVERASALHRGRIPLLAPASLVHEFERRGIRRVE